jgi:hypothetical protein
MTFVLNLKRRIATTLMIVFGAGALSVAVPAVHATGGATLAADAAPRAVASDVHPDDTPWG